MKAIVLGLLLLSGAALAEDIPQGTITSTGTSVTNASTAVPFVVAGWGVSTRLSVQCDGIAYIRTVSSSAATVSASTAATMGVKLSADQYFDIDLTGGPRWVAILSASGTVNCKVFVNTVAR